MIYAQFFQGLTEWGVRNQGPHFQSKVEDRHEEEFFTEVGDSLEFSTQVASGGLVTKYI